MDVNRLKEFAEHDNIQAQNNLGVAYMRGDGVECNEQQAFYWFHRAALHGNPEAITNLGICKLLGKGTEVDIGGALYILESAYLMGCGGVPQVILDAINNKDVEINTIISLAESKDTHAEWILALCYDNGVGIAKDKQKAWNLLNSASKDNNPVALWMLANFYANRPEVDLFRAKNYIEKAIEVAQKQVGDLSNTEIEKDMTNISKKLKEECGFLLIRVVPECREDGQPVDKYVRDLLDGKLFMKSLDQFSDISERDASSDNDYRGDILEGYAESFGLGYNPHLYKSDENGIIADGMLGSIDMLALRKKVYCLTAMDYYRPYHALIKPSEKMRKFGKYAIIISDVEEFLRRVRKAFDHYCQENNASFVLQYNRVSYDVNLYEKFNFSEFHKSKSYSWQNEFRISIDFSEGKFSTAMLDKVTDFAKLAFPREIKIDNNPLSLSDWIYFEIGDIRDICQCVEVENLFNSDEISIQIDKEPSPIEPYITQHIPRPTFCKGVTQVRLSDGKIHLAISKEGFFHAVL